MSWFVLCMKSSLICQNWQNDKPIRSLNPKNNWNTCLFIKKKNIWDYEQIPRLESRLIVYWYLLILHILIHYIGFFFGSAVRVNLDLFYFIMSISINQIKQDYPFAMKILLSLYCVFWKKTLRDQQVEKKISFV